MACSFRGSGSPSYSLEIQWWYVRNHKDWMDKQTWASNQVTPLILPLWQRAAGCSAARQSPSPCLPRGFACSSCLGSGGTLSCSSVPSTHPTCKQRGLAPLCSVLTGREEPGGPTVQDHVWGVRHLAAPRMLQHVGLVRPGCPGRPSQLAMGPRGPSPGTEARQKLCLCACAFSHLITNSSPCIHPRILCPPRPSLVFPISVCISLSKQLSLYFSFCSHRDKGQIMGRQL